MGTYVRKNVRTNEKKNLGLTTLTVNDREAGRGVQLKDRVVRPIFSIILLSIVVIDCSFGFQDLAYVLLGNG